MMQRLSLLASLLLPFALHAGDLKRDIEFGAQHPDWPEEQIQQKVKEIFMHAVT